MDVVFTPKQVALALGVSESTVKRWVDNGRLLAVKTLGGHRKLPLPGVVRFIRETGHLIERPEAIGLVAKTARSKPEELRDALYGCLVEGDEVGVRSLVLGLYEHGGSIADLGDKLVSPVFRRIGDAWSTGELQVHHERLSCTAMLAALYELRQLSPTPSADAPLALCASPHPDFAETPLRLVELTLLSHGWRTCMAGAGLPIDQIHAAIRAHRPRLVCLSATHVEDVPAFVEQVNQTLAEDLDKNVSLVIGGHAVEDQPEGSLKCDRVARRLADLEVFLEELAAI